MIKFYADIESKMIVKKANPNNDVYDIFYRATLNIKHIIIPPYIKTIRSCAFKNCENIESFEIGENSQLEKIEVNAFQNSSITKMKVPNNVKSIG